MRAPFLSRSSFLVSLVSASVLTQSSPSAHADVDVKLSGYVSSDVRFRILSDEQPPPAPQPSQWLLLKNGVSRNENRIRGTLNARIGDKVRAVADVEMVTWGFSDLSSIDSSTLRPFVDPFYFEFHAAYIDINNLFGSAIPRFDLRIGRQVVPWGSADKFNPIANVNTLDLSDPLMFGRALANNMVRADWNPIGDLNITAVLVPVFRPAQLPRTAPIALLDPLRLQGIRRVRGPFDADDVTRQRLRRRVVELTTILGLPAHPLIVRGAVVLLPLVS